MGAAKLAAISHVQHPTPIPKLRLRPETCPKHPRRTTTKDATALAYVAASTTAANVHELEKSWRRVPESNRRTRICNPLRNHSAKSPDAPRL